MLKSLWKDPVWSKVISAGILAACSVIGAYLLDLWPFIGGWLTSLWRTAGQPNQFANWVLWVLGLLAIPSMILVSALIWTTLRPEQQTGDNNWRSYLEDHFLGLHWRWNYFPSGRLEDPIPFCPHCDYQVFPHNASQFRAVDRIGFHCDSCDRDLPTFEEAFDTLQSKIRRFIEQKIRTGAWGGSAT